MGDSQTRKLEERIAHELLLMLALTGAALVQTTLLPTPLGFPPALLLILVVCRALVNIGEASPEEDVRRAIHWACYGGLALDVCAGTPLGSHALALLLVVLLLVLIVNNINIGGTLLPLLVVLPGTLIYETTLALIYHYTVARLDWGSHMLVIMLPSVLITLIPTLPVFYVMRWRYAS